MAVPETAGPYPAVVLLHGRSGDEDAMWIFARAVPRDWLIVAPRGLKPDPGGGYAWHPRGRDEWPALDRFEDAVTAVVRLIDALPDLYGADGDRVYLMGFSQGAATAYATAMRHPGRIKGIAGLVGFVPGSCGDEVRLAPLAGLPILMIAGRKDPLIPLARTRECARVLGAAGADLDYREYDMGHKLSVQGIRDLRQWWRDRAAEGLPANR